MNLWNAPQFLQKRGIKYIAGLDFETFFSTHYTLRKMSTSLYIYDAQFKAHGVAICNEYYNNERTIKARLNSIDWSITALLCHHTQFDGLILSHYYNILPAYLMCTMSMARPIYKNTVGAGLDKVSKELGHAGKTSDILLRTKGIRDLNYAQAQEMGEYCLQDVNEMKLVFDDLLPLTTEREMDIIDLTIRMYTNPKLECDIPRITKEVNTQNVLRNATMFAANLIPNLRGEKLKAHCKLMGIKRKHNDTRLQMIEKLLRSPLKFAELLTKAGVKVPMKTSPTTGKLTYAFAKTDVDFLALEQHRNQHVQNLFKARMAAKSTTALDKAIKLLEMSKFGPIPAYLNYWAAQTGRWSGGDKIQLQNMPRGGEMRKSLIAPPGYMLTVIDSSGIEMRGLAWFSGNNAILQMIQDEKDVYIDMAAQIYDIPYANVSKAQRFIGKIAILGLGYGCGAEKFQTILSSGAMGPPVDITISEAQRIVDMYRKKTNIVVTQLWIIAGSWLNSMFNKDCDIWYKGFNFKFESVHMPDGTILRYPNLKGTWNWNTASYTDISYQGPNNQTKYIYGGLFVENIVQALARSIIAEQSLAISKKYPCALLVHDESINITPEDKTKEAEAFMYKCFTTQPDWCKDLPLDAEYGTAREYSK